MNNKLYIPIQINGDLNSKVDPNKLELLPRELFVDKEGNLYFGNLQKVDQVNANKANQAQWGLNLGKGEKEQSFFKFDNEKQTGNLDNLIISKEGTLTKLNGNNSVVFSQVDLDASTFKNGSINNLNKLVLSKSLWDKKLPTDTSNFENGRVFFLVSE